MPPVKKLAPKRRKPAAAKAPALVPQTRAMLLRYLGAGMPIDMSARLAGVHPSTVRDWREKSRKGMGAPYRGFEDEVLKAIAEGEALHVARVAEAGRTNWRASAWLLERINPAKWALPDVNPPEDLDGAPPPTNPLADL